MSLIVLNILVCTECSLMHGRSHLASSTLSAPWVTFVCVLGTGTGTEPSSCAAGFLTWTWRPFPETTYATSLRLCSRRIVISPECVTLVVPARQRPASISA